MISSIKNLQNLSVAILSKIWSVCLYLERLSCEDSWSCNGGRRRACPCGGLAADESEACIECPAVHRSRRTPPAALDYNTIHRTVYTVTAEHITTIDMKLV